MQWPVGFNHYRSFVQPLPDSFSSPSPRAKCSILLTEMSSKSHGFIKWWPRCLYLNVAKALQWQRMREAISDACLHPPVFVHIWTANAPCVSHLSGSWLPPWQPLQIYQVEAQVLWLDARNLFWVTGQLFHFHQFLCALAPISAGFCYVLPVSVRIDGSPRLLWVVRKWTVLVCCISDTPNELDLCKIICLWQ